VSDVIAKANAIDRLDLSKLTFAELKQLVIDAEAEMTKAKAESFELAREQMAALIAGQMKVREELAKDYGFKLQELTRAPAIKAKTRKPTGVLYVNPADPRQKYKGKGKSPSWLPAKGTPERQAMLVTG
jgi:DNA-binding protein H-NS